MTALLFIDFGTTGLDVNSLTALECAWAITDLDGAQRIPLRHRYTAISHSDAVVHPVQPDGESVRWKSIDCSELYQAEALKMAEDSGLFEDWLRCPQEQILFSSVELERLILDDIVSTCIQKDDVTNTSPETVHLCGAGVARFDFSIVSLLCPRIITGNRYPVHYRAVDTSVCQTGLLGNNYERELIDWFISKYGEYADNECLIELSQYPLYSYQDTSWQKWIFNSVGLHRAVPDVARSVVVQRALWNYGQSLRRDLDLSV
jgi:hypothetical protein